MTDNLVKRLRSPTEHEAWLFSVPYQAADRIEALEAALREIAATSKIMAKGEDMETALKVMLSSHRNTAIAALAGEKSSD